MTLSIRVASSPGEARIAVVDGDRLIDYALWRPGAPDGVGDVHVGRVVAAVPAMAGAFVALADAEGFLPDSEGGKGLTAGTILPVRITRAAQAGKGPRLTAKLDEPVAGGSPRLLRRGPEPIGWLAERYPDAAIVVDDAGLAAAVQAELRRRVSIIAAVFDEDIAEAIDALSRPVVELPGGARLSIWPTPALVAIDVDAGGALGGTAGGIAGRRGLPDMPRGELAGGGAQGKEDARIPREGGYGSGGARSRHEALNRAILPALAEQIRLRNLSGGIVVDLAGLAPRRRAVLAPDFVRALANDPLRPKFLGFTALGLAEIVRARVHPPLHELLSGPLAAGLTALRAVIAAGGPDPRGRDPRRMPAIRAHPAVVAALQSDPAALPDLARRTGRAVTLRSDPSLPHLTWLLETEHGQET
ncbi:MAG: ribonuclease E/G [Rhodopila sp.]